MYLRAAARTVRLHKHTHRLHLTPRVGERTILAIYSKKKRRLAEQTAASLSVQGPDLDRSRLAVMTANDDPLDVRSACPFPGQMRREGLLGFASTPNWLSPSSRIGSVDPIIRKCPEVMTRQCKKIGCRGKQTTERGQQMHWCAFLLSASSCSIYQSRHVKNAPVTLARAT